jgi:hypothetical protein
VRRAIPLLLVVAALAAGCGSGGDERIAPPDQAAEVAPPPPPSRPSTQRCLAGTARSYARHGVAAVARRSMSAYRSVAGPLLARFDRVNVNGVATTFRVLGARLGSDCRPTWYRVQLPIRPNGVTGWVQADTVRRYTVDHRIVVDLSERRVTVYRHGAIVASTRTAIGRPETPTPTGSFYVNQRLLASDSAGPWGPGGIGISAFSPVLTGWTQGGPIAIHGTNRPETIGRAASNGCLRIANGLLKRLIHEIPDGTPVTIRA